MDSFKKTQEEIDVMFSNPADTVPVSERILAIAKRGLDTPETLFHKDIQLVCYALVAHYASVGIH